MKNFEIVLKHIEDTNIALSNQLNEIAADCPINPESLQLLLAKAQIALSQHRLSM